MRKNDLNFIYRKITSGEGERCMKRILIIIVTIFLLLAGCAPSSSSVSVDESAESKETMKIGYLPITHAAPLLLAAEKVAKEHPEYELELVKFSSWPDLIDALNAGQIDGTSLLLQLAMQAKHIGVDLTAIALGHQDGNVIISRPEITSVSQLKGETFAIPHTHSAHHLLVYELLTSEGIDYEAVNLVEMPPAEMPAALAEGRIAGYAVAEPFGALALQLEVGHVLAHSSEFWPNSYCCVLVLRDEIIQERKELALTFTQDYIKAGLLANEKDESLYEALQAHMDVDEALLDISLEWITYDALRIEEEEYRKLLDRVTTLQLIDEPPSYDQFVHPTIFDQAVKKHE